MQGQNTGIIETVADSGEQIIGNTIDTVTGVASSVVGATADINEHLVSIESTLVSKLGETGQLTISELGDLIKDLTGHFTNGIKAAKDAL